MGAPPGTPPSQSFGLLAVLRVLTVTALALLQEALREEELVVPLRDPDRGQQDRLRAADLAVHAGNRLALDDRDRGRRSCVGLLADRLVDGSALPTGEDELHTRRRRVLARQRDRLQAVRLQRGDHRTGEPVVRRQRGVHLVPVPREDLVEDLATLDRIPLRPLVTGGRLLEGAAVVQGA